MLGDVISDGSGFSKNCCLLGSRRRWFSVVFSACGRTGLYCAIARVSEGRPIRCLVASAPCIQRIRGHRSGDFHFLTVFVFRVEQHHLRVFPAAQQTTTRTQREWTKRIKGDRITHPSPVFVSLWSLVFAFKPSAGYLFARSFVWPCFFPPQAGDVDAALDLMGGMEACGGWTGASEYNQVRW